MSSQEEEILSKIKNGLLQKIDHPKKYYAFYWKMHPTCNYKCPYCFQTNYRKDPKNNKVYSHEEILAEYSNIHNFIESHVKDLSVKLHFIGGEPTIQPIDYLIESGALSNKITRLSMITNLSRDEKYFNRLFQLCEDKNIKLDLTASFHPSQLKDVNEFFNKTKLFVKKVNLVMTEDNFDYVKGIVDNWQNLTTAKLELRWDFTKPLNDKITNYVRENTQKHKEVASKDYFILYFTDGTTQKISLTDFRYYKNFINFDEFYCNSWPTYRYDEGLIFADCAKNTHDPEDNGKIRCFGHCNCSACKVFSLEKASM